MAAKNHIVKINEEQYSYLKGEDDTRPFDGNSTISVAGKLDTSIDGNPKTGDDVSRAFTPQAWTYYRTNRRGRISENEHVSNGDYDHDNVDDFYNVGSANTLSNGNKQDNLSVVPQTILTRVNALIQAMNTANLSDVQKANVVNEFLEAIDFSTMPYKLKKEIRLKIN